MTSENSENSEYSESSEILFKNENNIIIKI